MKTDIKEEAQINLRKLDKIGEDLGTRGRERNIGYVIEKVT